MIPTYRNCDAVITICQDDAAKEVRIGEVNEAAATLLGAGNDALGNQPLTQILPERICTLLHEYVEFEEYGNDVGQVLAKVQSFSLLGADKSEITCRVKVARSTPIDNLSTFTLMLHTSQLTPQQRALRDLLKSNFKGHEVLDETTGLPDRDSVIKDIEYVHFYVHKQEVGASVAVLELDHFASLQEMLTAQQLGQLFRDIETCIGQSLRSDDLVGFLAPKRLAIILFDTNRKSAHMVLNRLRWLITAQQYPAIEHADINVSIVYATMHEGRDDKDIIHRMESYMDQHQASNNVAELPREFGIEEIVY